MATVVPVVARAIDQAGNVGPTSDPLLIVLDTTGPAHQRAATRDAIISGTLYDGSGVAEVAISLDGGTTYQLVDRNGSDWSFDRSTWAGGTPLPFGLVRAVDVHGNVAQVVFGLDLKQVYLPLVRR